ncbi:hypothetical protein SeMB42_g02282 [Synchytrium endobioticum]|uniref:Ribosomal protein S6 n=1 Tax=Synchytrium endobioticum TaxID=286115 RepID=A0A507CVI4_9FUNG|nr:hypothetical protein SeLEV6574_g05345 [Synchytrium endobioticum]TPX50382.1 hypothetical protein SeMB42_g02282 [Synchytrium endobioticum]
MPLYELVCIVRAHPQILSRTVGYTSAISNVDYDQKTKSLMKMAALHILDGNGVVRKLTHSSHTVLPYRMKKYREIHATGSYVTMVFDAHPSMMETLKRAVEFEEHVIRHTVVKLGDSVKYNTPVKPEAVA